MDRSQPQSSSSQLKQRSLGKYVLAGILGALIAYLAGSFFAPAPTLALPQEGRACDQGVMAVPAQVASDTYGLYLIDLQNQTILLYSYGGPWSKGLRLLSARSFRYDRQLVDFNSGEPSPQDVRQLLEAGMKMQTSPDGSEKAETDAVAEPTTAPEP